MEVSGIAEHRRHQRPAVKCRDPESLASWPTEVDLQRSSRMHVSLLLTLLGAVATADVQEDRVHVRLPLPRFPAHQLACMCLRHGLVERPLCRDHQSVALDALGGHFGRIDTDRAAEIGLHLNARSSSRLVRLLTSHHLVRPSCERRSGFPRPQALLHFRRQSADRDSRRAILR